MPHINLPEGLPGITSAFAFRPETAKPLRALAEVLLRGPSSLTSGEREMIATFVSNRNDCYFCKTSHRAAAAHHLSGNYDLPSTPYATTTRTRQSAESSRPCSPSRAAFSRAAET